MNQRQRFLTPEGRDRLREELDELKTVRRPDVAARIHISTEGGGTVNNAEYEEVKNEQAFERIPASRKRRGESAGR